MKEKEDAKPIPDKETTTAEVAGSKKVKTVSKDEYSDQKKAVMGAMNTHYGDGEVTDDNYNEKMEGMVKDHYMPAMDKLDKYHASNKNVLAMMDSEPVLSSVLSDMGNGGKFMDVLPRYVDMETIKEKGGEDAGAWEENKRIREEAYNNKLARKQELADNEQMSIKTYGEFSTENKMDEAGAEAFGKYIAETLQDAYDGKMSKEFLTRMLRSMKYELDMADAEKVGETKGKNEKIVAEKMNDKELASDTLPIINSGRSEAQDQANKPATPDFVKRLGKKVGERASIYDEKNKD